MRLSGPMNRLGCSAHIVRASHADAVTVRQLADALAPSACMLDLVETFREAVAVHREIVQGTRRRAQKIGAAHREGIELELARQAIEHAFESMARIHRAMAAHRSAWRQIGVYAIAIILDRRNVVDALQQRAGVEDRDDAVAGVSAAALHHFALAGRDAAVAQHSELQPDVGLRTRAMSEKILLASKPHHHLSVGGAGQKRGDDLEIEHLDARAKTPAN